MMSMLFEEVVADFLCRSNQGKQRSSQRWLPKTRKTSARVKGNQSWRTARSKFEDLWEVRDACFQQRAQSHQDLRQQRQEPPRQQLTRQDRQQLVHSCREQVEQQEFVRDGPEQDVQVHLDPEEQKDRRVSWGAVVFVEPEPEFAAAFQPIAYRLRIQCDACEEYLPRKTRNT